MGRLLARREHDESGAIAIIVALLSVVLLMGAALTVDIAMQVNRKHQLHDTLDAAAQTGAFELPDSTASATAAALEFAERHDPTEQGSLAPSTDFWCVVASKKQGADNVVETTQIPSTCYPGPGPYTVGATYRTTGREVTCSRTLCAIPCVEPSSNTGTPKVACNTIRVFQGRVVPFGFAPAGGISEGSTGNLVSVACKGSCGTVAPNPLDVAVVADRTVSMTEDDLDDMIGGIKGMLGQMTPSQQYVALGAIGRSHPVTTSQGGSCNSTSKGLTYPSASGSSGKWIPVGFSADYKTGADTLNNGSTLLKGVDCLANMSDPYQGTVLAAPMKAAAQYLLGTATANNLSSLPARTPTPKKVIIFETDGQPNERQPTAGDASLSSGDVYSHPMSVGPGVTATQPDTTEITSATSSTITKMVTHRKTVTHVFNGGANACNNLINVAANAKAQGILVIMIGYNMFENGQPKRCNDYDGTKDDYSNLNVSSPRDSNVNTSTVTTVANPSERTLQPCPAPDVGKTCVTNYQTTTTTKHVEAGAGTSVLDVMAQAASPIPAVDGVGGGPSTAQNDCSTPALRGEENSDGDYLFCAASGTDMAPIFTTALSQASKGIKLMRMPS